MTPTEFVRIPCTISARKSCPALGPKVKSKLKRARNQLKYLNMIKRPSSDTRP